ncbi:unnamed protein product [Enterobius vermicularis]|uniref:OCRE domain-containing protein n=1 Tax=Enterobius vermicularis TaxID=51028 RepID=A0A0N4UX33_ENTVE|nr:unnamed protein product [Enterobius vermicularis]
MELFSRKYNVKSLISSNKIGRSSVIYSRLSTPITEHSVHYDDRTDPDFPRLAPPARSLYDIPRGYNVQRPQDYDFRRGLRQLPTQYAYTVSDPRLPQQYTVGFATTAPVYYYQLSSTFPSWSPAYHSYFGYYDQNRNTYYLTRSKW